MTIEIKHYWNNRVLHKSEKETLKEALEEAVAEDKELSGAILDGARLSGARLSGARLSGAILDGAILDGARLDGAILDGARLSGAILDGARLSGAILDGAILDGARLSGARLSGAILDGAILDGARLDGAILDGARLDESDLNSFDRIHYFAKARVDFEKVLSTCLGEIVGLRAKIVAGEVDGSVYSGVCACLLGTIAKLRGCNYQSIPGLEPDSNRPIERFFTCIRPGSTPENNLFARLAVKWIDDYVVRAEALAVAQNSREGAAPQGSEG